MEPKEHEPRKRSDVEGSQGGRKWEDPGEPVKTLRQLGLHPAPVNPIELDARKPEGLEATGPRKDRDQRKCGETDTDECCPQQAPPRLPLHPFAGQEEQRQKPYQRKARVLEPCNRDPNGNSTPKCSPPTRQWIFGRTEKPEQRQHHQGIDEDLHLGARPEAAEGGPGGEDEVENARRQAPAAVESLSARQREEQRRRREERAGVKRLNRGGRRAEEGHSQRVDPDHAHGLVLENVFVETAAVQPGRGFGQKEALVAAGRLDHVWEPDERGDGEEQQHPKAESERGSPGSRGPLHPTSPGGGVARSGSSSQPASPSISRNEASWDQS